MRGSPRIRILGVGSILRADDGVGVRVAEQLMARHFPRNVEVLEVGTAGLDLLYAFEDVEELILIDAVNMEEPPGTVKWFSSEEVATSAPTGALSLHEVGPAEVLALAERLGEHLSLSICGIQPGSLDYAMELTPAVAASVPTAVELVCRKVENMLR